MENVDLNHLSSSEYEKIISVLKRDRELRSQEEMRIQQLKKDLAYLRRRAALRPGVDADRCCARCLELLGRILNRGALCPLCHKKICKSCRRFSSPVPQCDDDIPSNNGPAFFPNLRQAKTYEHEWLCVVCHKRMQLKAVSGEWMEEYSASSKKEKTSPGDQLRRVIHETQRKSLLSTIDQKERSISTFNLALHDISAPPKPPRTYAHSSDSTSSSMINEDSNKLETTKKFKSVVETSSSSEPMAVDKMKSKSASVSSEGNISPRPSPRISPWNGIEAEPKIPVRSLRAASFGHLMSIDCSSDPWIHGERNNLEDTRSMMSLHSQSTGSEIADDLKNIALTPKSRRKVSPLKKQSAVPEPSSTTMDSLQHSSLDTTDSGIFSPGLKSEDTLSYGTSPHSPLKSVKSDSSPLKVSNGDSDVLRSPLLSTKSESDAPCSSEASDTPRSPFPHVTMSDASSSETESKNPKVTKRVVFKKRKQSSSKEIPKKLENKLKSKKDHSSSIGLFKLVTRFANYKNEKSC